MMLLASGKPHPQPLPTAVERGASCDLLVVSPSDAVVEREPPATSQWSPPLHRNGEGAGGWGLLPYLQMPASVQATASAFWVDATSSFVTKLLIASVYDCAQPSFAAAPC